MIRLNCELTKDLLPLYVDDVCSDETKKSVKEHLKECESCRSELIHIKKDFPVTPENSEIEVAVKKANEKFKKLKKKTVIKTLSIILAATLISGFIGFFRISYELMHYKFWTENQGALGENLLIFKNTGAKTPNVKTKNGNLFIDEKFGEYSVKVSESANEEQLNTDEIVITDTKTTVISFNKNKNIVILDTSYEEIDETCLFPTSKTKKHFYPDWISLSIIKKGFENLGIDTKYQGYFNKKTMQELLLLYKNPENSPHYSGFFSSTPKDFINSYAISAFFYQVLSLDGANNYIICESDFHYGYGFCRYEKDLTRYTLFIQDADDIKNQRTIQFVGFTEEEVKEIYDSFQFQ